MLATLLPNLIDKQPLAAGEVRAALGHIMAGNADPVELAAFLAAWRSKGETPDELAAAVTVMREHMVPLDAGGLAVLDTCGTGGDGSGTFNISTATALVVAGCGVPVVKHGNRGVSSTSGSADVLTALGVKIDHEPADVGRGLRETSFAFCFAPRFHPAMRHVADVRKRLRFRTIFNLMGPLCNPAGARLQLLGVGRPELLDLLAEALARLGTENAYVVHAADGLDEVSLSGPTHVRHATAAGVTREAWTPESFGLPKCERSLLCVNDPVESAATIRAVLENAPGPARDIVLANAAAGLLAARRAATLVEGVNIAAEALASGKARAVLERLVALSD